MFTVEDHDSEAMADCIYPALDESLESFNSDDVATVAAVVSTEENSRETCNYEWVDYLDEVKIYCFLINKKKSKQIYKPHIKNLIGFSCIIIISTRL